MCQWARGRTYPKSSRLSGSVDACGLWQAASWARCRWRRPRARSSCPSYLFARPRASLSLCVPAPAPASASMPHRASAPRAAMRSPAELIDPGADNCALCGRSSHKTVRASRPQACPAAARSTSSLPCASPPTRARCTEYCSGRTDRVGHGDLAGKTMAFSRFHQPASFACRRRWSGRGCIGGRSPLRGPPCRIGRWCTADMAVLPRRMCLSDSETY